MSSQVTQATVQLAGQAASLSGELFALQERCQHEATGTETANIANELAHLSTTLWTLQQAMETDADQYTPAFIEDLKEITNELGLVFEEISDCCHELQQADSRTLGAPWFFKKGRVTRLIRHLETLKGTLAVMRTVLWHGKDYGTYTSTGRLAESDPHTMHEDKVILESLLTRNRSAIHDFHNTSGVTTVNRSLSRTKTPTTPGQHLRALTDATGVDVPPMPDVLPPEKKDPEADEARNMSPASLDRTFSKRGARLGVHMSILDMNAHEASDDLRHKWIHEARMRTNKNNINRRGNLTALPELSKISEADSLGSKTTTYPQSAPAMTSPIVPSVPEPVTIAMEPLSSRSKSPLTNTPVPSPDAKMTPLKSIKKLMHKFSTTSLRSPSSRRKENLTNSASRAEKGKQRESSPFEMRNGNTRNEKRSGRLFTNMQVVKADDEKHGLMHKLSRKFSTPQLV